MPPEEKILGAPETANVLSVSQSTLAKWRMLGTGPKFYKLGRRVLNDPQDISAWLKSHKRASTSDIGRA